MNLREVYEQYLISVISKQCSNTKAYIDQYRPVLANNRQSAGFNEAFKELTFALTVTKTDGAHVYDMDENRYLDITMGFGVHLFGHSPSFIKEAISSQLEKGISLGPLFEDASLVAQLICKMTGNERCAFYNSGTEAVMVALRLARAATGKKKTVIFAGSYHGTYDPLLAMKVNGESNAVANIPGITDSLVADTVLLPFGEERSLDYIIKHADEIAAVLTEPVRSRHPECVQPDFLFGIEEICDQFKIAFVLDEIISGFRVASGGAKELFGLNADMVVYGKVLGGGLPIGVVAGKKRYMDYVDGGNWSFNDDSRPLSPTTFVAGTFCHHPLAMATASATLKRLDAANGQIQRDLNDSTTTLCHDINVLCEQIDVPIRAANFGSLFRFLLKGKHKILYHCLLKERIYIWEGRNCFLSTVHDSVVIEKLIGSIEKSLLEMKAAGYFKKSRETVQSLNRIHMNAGLIVEGELKVKNLELAFNYLCECIAAVNKTKYSYKFDALVQESEHDADILLSAAVLGSETSLQLRVDRQLFDGWSMILMLRFLGVCYEALENEINLPPHPFVRLESQASASRSLHKTSNAITISKYIETFQSNNSFESLLSSFAQALDQQETKISIPLSNQLISRRLQAVGKHTVYGCVEINNTDKHERSELVNAITKQLQLIRFHESKRTYSPESNIIFNVDNIKRNFKFGSRRVKLIPVEDSKTFDDLVFNVIVEPSGLLVSVKFKESDDGSYYDALLNRFCSLVSNNVHVPAQG